jgi:hypothetical protein
MKHTRRIALALMLTALVLAGASGAEKPKLILAVVVDQFRYDYLTRFRADYHAGFDRLLNSDESTQLLGGIPGAIGSSPRRLLVSTIGDELRMAGKGAQVIGVSIKGLCCSDSTGRAGETL